VIKAVRMLETARIRMLPWEGDDEPAFRRLATDPRVMLHISGGEPWGDEKIREFLTRQIRQQRELGFCIWKLVLKEVGEVIGICGLQPLAGTSDIEIGWWLAPEQWGKGIAVEAARAALAYAFDSLGLTRVVAVAHLGNEPSVRTMEKLGMTFECNTTHKGVEVVKYAIEKK